MIPAIVGVIAGILVFHVIPTMLCREPDGNTERITPTNDDTPGKIEQRVENEDGDRPVVASIISPFDRMEIE